MQKSLIPLALLLSPLVHAQAVMPDVKKNPISLLPEGSVLKGVLLPRYDDDKKLVGDLKAEVMTLVDETRIEGENVRIKFYEPDGKVRGNIILSRASFNQETSQLHADEPLEIITDSLVARGTGIAYGFENGEGFLNGPATTWIKAAPKISMNNRRLPSPAVAAALLTSFAPLSANAAPPDFVSETELAAVKSDAESLQPTVDSANRSSEAALEQSKAEATKLSTAAQTFIKQSELRSVATGTAEKVAEAEPLKIEPSPDDTVIKCEKGMYFDSEGGVLVYLGNVQVTDPRFTLTGANELKVFFDKKESGDKKANAEDKMGSGFGEVQRLVATGAVRILQKSVNGKDPVEASGAILTYDVSKGEIIISDGFPWVKQGKFFARAKEANLTLRLMDDGSFSTRGNWEMGGQLNLDR
ncbi:LptA/OstA family protein [Luteolibacter sp. AS25]|uniref:LptA/OstA family protein n=1 Tax=Luteolibacter sp. AS25 TaxID=3135776 RepID=UPI00398B9650